MACQINRTKDGKINNVTTPTGAKSKLFEAIHGNIFLADAETSVKIYNNAYSQKVEKVFEGETLNKYDTGEPQLFYKAPSNKVYDNLEEVLIFEEFGDISMGFKNPKNDEFIPVANFTNKGSEKNEFLTAKVREGLISADRVLGVDGVTRYQGKGEYDTTRKVTGLFVAEDLMAETGNGRVKVLDDGTIEMEFANGYSEVIDENGNSSAIRTESIPEFLRLNPNTKNKVDLITEYVIKFDNPRPIDKDVTKIDLKTTDLKGLENSLMGFLKSLGFSVTSLENYRNNYNTKYGEGSDVGALADIANSIIAFRNGQMTAEDLSEEVAHIAIEAFADQASITTALANVHLTPEYAEMSERYRKRYSKDGLSAIELEDKVRKEILGKLLKKELISRFDTQNKTSEEVYLIKKLKEIWNNFMDMLRGNAKPYHTSLLQELNERIADSVLNQNSKDFLGELLEGNNSYYYSLMDKNGKMIHDDLARSRTHIEDLYNSYIKEPSPSLGALEDMSDTMSDYRTVSAVNTVVGTAEKQMRLLKEATEEAVSKDERLSTKDRHRYEVLKENLLPTINNLIAELTKSKNLPKTDVNSIRDEKLISTIDRLSDSAAKLAVEMSQIEPAINNDKLAWVDRMLMKSLDHTSLTEEQKEEIKTNLDGGFRDIGFLGKMFGLSSHSKNMALQLMHFSVMNITARTNRKFLSRMNELLADITLKDGFKHQRSIIHKDADGKQSHYVDSMRDYAWEDKMIKDKKAEIIANKTGKEIEEVVNSLEEKSPQELLNDAQFIEFKEELNKFIQEEVRERRFKESYYTERDARYDKANVSDITRNYLSTKNSNMNFRHKEGGHIKPDGTKDLSGQTESEKRQDLEDKQNHRQVSSPYDVLGNIKPGLKRVKVSELTEAQKASMPIKVDNDFTGDVTILEDGMTLEELTESYPDSRVSLDIFNHNMQYRNELSEKSKSNEPIKEFFKKVKELEEEGEVAYDWVISNASLAITSNFYEGMSNGRAKDIITQEYIDGIADPKEKESLQVQFDLIKELKRSRSELLKQNKKSHSAVEYDAKHMTDQVRGRLLELDTEISERTRGLNIPFETYDELEESIMESSLNEDYYKMFDESPMTSEFEFAMQHAPAHSQEKIRGFGRQVEDYVNGRSSFISPSYARFISRETNKGLLEGENLSKEDIAKLLKDAYARENVATYFKRFHPKGYTEVLAAMKDGTISMSEVLNKDEKLLEKYPALEFMEFNPDYTWREEVTNEDNLNPNFKSGDTNSQPRKLNDQFFEKYFTNPEEGKAAYLALQDEDLNKLTPTKNKEQYEYLKTTVAINKEIIENYGSTGRVNPYLRVQMKKSDMERALTIHKSGKGDFKDWINDVIKSQIDEKEYGEQIKDTGINIKKVPKYYQQKVEDPSFLTQNTLQASLISLKASIKYKERLLAEQDVKAIEYKISQQDFKSSGGNSLKARIQKKGQVSNYYSKAQEMADYHLYGIRQNRKMITTVLGKEVDFTQIISRFTKYVRNVNLAYNPLVDVTSLTTGVYNNLIDTMVGDYYHKSSVSKAAARMPKLMALYMSQEGTIRKTSELNHLLEWLNVFSEDERLEMSSYNRATRVASNSFYLGAKVANLPVTPRNMLAILYDNKFHNGRFKSYNEFSRDMRIEFGKEISNKEITARWAKNTDTFYSNLDIDPSLGIRMGENFKEKFGDKASEEFDFYHEKLTAKITQVNQSVDSIVSNEDQTAAQRDALANALMMHRSWFLINMTRKWKGKHFNLATGQFEAGHYITAVSTLKKVFKNGISKEEKQAFRDIVEEHEIRNLVRAGVDGIGIFLLIALTNMLMDNDDDDDTAIENFAQLIALRTTNETQSQHIIGVYGTIESMYTEPLVQRRLVNDLIQGVVPAIASLAGAELDEKTQGKADRFWRQNIYGRRTNQMGSLDQQIGAYLKYNHETLWWVNAADQFRNQ